MKSNVANLLKLKRKNSGLSVKTVKEKLSDLGIAVAEKTIYGWESGQRQPDADTFMALCNLYGVKSFSEIENAPAMTAEALDADDIIILEYFHTLSSDQKSFLLAVLQVLSEQTQPISPYPLEESDGEGPA